MAPFLFTSQVLEGKKHKMYKALKTYYKVDVFWYKPVQFAVGDTPPINSQKCKKRNNMAQLKQQRVTIQKSGPQLKS